MQIFLNLFKWKYFLQFTTFLTSQCTTDLLINVLSSALFYIIFVIKYISFSININVVSKTYARNNRKLKLYCCFVMSGQNEMN